ncbi:MAG: hypothetical protein QOK15_3910 [Nocardioidaceae bacterium]|nr:hypothetical protein [Nocardioidaceae bacterium]
MIGTNEIDRIQGATAYDNSGDKIGKVDQVYLDDQTGEPSWLTLNTGLFGTSTTFAPLEGAAFDGDDLRIGYDKEQVKNAPRIEVDQHLERDQEEELYRYYGLSYAGSGVGTGETTEFENRGTEAPTTSTTDEAAVRLSEERLQVGTETQEAGRARLRKYTTTETETVTVPVTKEKLVVERNPVEGRTSSAPISDTDEVEEVTLREERAVVDKETVDVEEVRIGKEQVTEQERVSGEVRKEHAEVEGDVTDASSGTQSGTGLNR